MGSYYGLQVQALGSQPNRQPDAGGWHELPLVLPPPPLLDGVPVGERVGPGRTTTEVLVGTGMMETGVLVAPGTAVSVGTGTSVPEGTAVPEGLSVQVPPLVVYVIETGACGPVVSSTQTLPKRCWPTGQGAP